MVDNNAPGLIITTLIYAFAQSALMDPTAPVTLRPIHTL